MQTPGGTGAVRLALALAVDLALALPFVMAFPLTLTIGIGNGIAICIGTSAPAKPVSTPQINVIVEGETMADFFWLESSQALVRWGRRLGIMCRPSLPSIFLFSSCLCPGAPARRREKNRGEGGSALWLATECCWRPCNPIPFLFFLLAFFFSSSFSPPHLLLIAWF